MAEISGGGMSFTSTMDNSQLDKAVEETLRRLQGLSEGAVAVGDAMDSSTAELVEQINIQKKVIQELETSYNDLNDKINSVEPGTAQDVLIEQANAVKAELDDERNGLADLTRQLSELQTANASASGSLETIRATLSKVGAACEVNENAIAKLKEEYDSVNIAMGKAFSSGNDSEYNALKQRAEAIKGEVAVRRSLLNELREQSNALEESAQKIEQNRQTVEANANAHVSLRQQIRALREEMAAAIAGGMDEQSEEYKKMANELGRLQDIQSDIQSQGSVLANDEAKFAGVLSGLNGLVGGFTAAQGAIALFAGENENLQKIMLKVQSLMSITMGLQQVSQTLNKDSAFMLVTLNSLKTWWNKLTGQSVVEETAETAATTANTAANTANAASNTAKANAARGATTATAANTAVTGANTVAAQTGAAANGFLAASFRAIGTAIKALPVFGMIVAGIASLVSIIKIFTDSEDDNTESVKKNKEAQKDLQEEMTATERVHAETIRQIAEERGKIQLLNDIVHDNTVAIGDRRKALSELKRIIPSYNALLDAEGKLTRDNTRAIDDYISALDRQAMAKAAQKELEALSTKEVQAKLKQMRAQRTMDDNQWGNDYVNPNDATNRNKGHENTAVRDATSVRGEAYQQQTAEAAKAKENYAQASKDMDAAKKDAQKIAQDKKDIMALIKSENLTTDVVTSATSGGSGGGKGGSTHGTTAVETDLQKLEKLLVKAKQGYQEYYKWLNSGDKIVREAAGQEFSGLLAQGSTYLEYLQRQRDQIMKIDAGKRTTEQTNALRKLNDEIAEETKQTVLESFNNELATQLGNAKSIIEMLNIIEEKRKELKNDGSELDNNKKDALDDAEEDVKGKQKERTSQLLEDYASYTAKRLKMEQEYIENVMLLQKELAKATTDQDRDNIKAALENLKVQYTKDSKSSGDEDYDNMLETFKSYEQKRADISAEYDEKRRIARLHGNEELVKQLNVAEAKAQLSNSFDELQASPEYITAFEDLKNVSKETLEALLARFEEVKESAAESLNPEDLREFTDTMTKMADEINQRNAFEALKNGYKELRQASMELKAAEKELDEIRANGGKGTASEAAAINKVNKAKDNYIKQNNKVRQSEKKVTSQVKELCDELSNVGKEIGGEAGDIISLIGDIGSFVMSTVDSFKTVTSATAQAMSTMEKASVILTVISAAFQLANKISSMFGDGGEAEYKRAEEVYKEYISVLDDVIDKQKELMESMSGENAKNSYKYALQLVQEASDAARELGKQYLNDGAGSGFWGIGSSASHGVDQRKNISGEGWEQLKKMYEEGILSLEQYNSVAKGRMTGLFDLTAEQLTYLKEHAPVFWANLSEETRTYLQQIIDCQTETEELQEKIKESLTGVDFSSVNDDFLDMLSDWDVSTKELASNMSEYIRKSLIRQMFLAQYKDQLKKWYDMWAKAIDPEGEGGSSITEKEQEALNTLRDSIINGATEAAKQINDQFENPNEDEDNETLSGSVKGVSEETASLVSGQMNAIRINQMEATEMLRQQLAMLSTIAINTGYNHHLAKLDRIVSLLESNFGDASLRSQGLY